MVECYAHSTKIGLEPICPVVDFSTSMVAVGGLEPPPAPSKGVYGFRVRCPTLDDTALKLHRFSQHIQLYEKPETNQLARSTASESCIYTGYAEPD